VFSSAIDVPEIKSFETGLLLYGAGNGVCYNVNNKVNHRLDADGTGWSNQNTFLGGRYSHNSNEGTVVAGTCHVLMPATTNVVNGNVWVGTSLESPDVVKYHLDCAGWDNTFNHCRWENIGSGARVVWRAGSKGNQIVGGYDAHQIVQTVEPGTQNEIHSRLLRQFIGGNSDGPNVDAREPVQQHRPRRSGHDSGGPTRPATPSPRSGGGASRARR
jgi:hypothetical protein